MDNEYVLLIPSALSFSYFSGVDDKTVVTSGHNVFVVVIVIVDIYIVIMATYYDKAFELASADKSCDLVCPWWDLLSTMTIQFSMLIALTSVSMDVFSQFGSGIKCTPMNVTKTLNLQQVRLRRLNNNNNNAILKR